MKASVARGGDLQRRGWVGGSCSGREKHSVLPPPPNRFHPPTNFRLISISIAVASFSLLRHAPQVAEVTQRGWWKCGWKMQGEGVEKWVEGRPRGGAVAQGMQLSARPDCLYFSWHSMSVKIASFSIHSLKIHTVELP